MKIKIPKIEMLSPDELKLDPENPNLMTERQHQALAKSIERFGFVVPVITNEELVIADGEQRWTVSKTLGMREIPVIRLPIKEVDKRLIRQVLNKLRGEHDIMKDAMEFQKLVLSGAKEDLITLLATDSVNVDIYTAMLKDSEVDPMIGQTEYGENKYRFTVGNKGMVAVNIGDYGAFVEDSIVDKAKEFLKALENDARTRKRILQELCEKISKGDAVA
jgi:hypothetical protein